MEEAIEFLENRNRERIQNARTDRAALRAECVLAGLDLMEIFPPQTANHGGRWE